MKAQSRTEESDLSEDRELCLLGNSMYSESGKGRAWGWRIIRFNHHPAGFPAFLMASRMERIEDQVCTVAL